MGLLTRLLLGDGTLTPAMRAALEAEGLVLIEENLPGKLRYSRFKAPGRRFHGKVTPERIGFAISEERVVAYCRSGKAKLIDSPFSNPLLDVVEVSTEDDELLALRIDYDRGDVPEVSGQVTITARTPRAPEIAEELRRRIARARSPRS